MTIETMNIRAVLIIAGALFATPPFHSALSAAPPSRLAQESPPHARPGGDEHVVAQAFLGVRVLKTEAAGDLDWSVQLPADCADCRLVINEITSAENPKEFYFHFFASSARDQVHGVRVKVNPSKVRGVVVGRARVPFTKTADGIIFDVPRHDPLDLVSELHTLIETPGVRIRIEHADEQRRRGDYAVGPWPALQRQAVLNSSSPLAKRSTC